MDRTSSPESKYVFFLIKDRLEQLLNLPNQQFVIAPNATSNFAHQGTIFHVQKKHLGYLILVRLSFEHMTIIRHYYFTLICHVMGT